jgi:serine/threonine-protein kinase
MIPETGRKLGPYEIQGRLGGGGMGHVFRAWDARLHREVAIKLLNHEYTMPGMRERFLREARAASALNHPNICTVFDIGEQDGDPYLVMELLQGENLKDRIQDRALPLDQIISIARDTAEGLGAAHAKGVVHRDIKPANIFLVEKPNGGIQAKVLDFGLAKVDSSASRGRALDLTTFGATVGTLAYMSPEQARGEVLDSRSDLFSLGVVMYEMATRHVPFQGTTSALVFVQLLNHPPEPVREWNEAVPRELEKIIFKLLAKERTARFQTARELELALIALGEKGGAGNWLRKAVSSVPLVRASDPVARVRRLPPQRTSSGGGLRKPSESAGLGPPTTESSPPAKEASRGNSTGDGQVLRPVVRLPRDGATPYPKGLEQSLSEPSSVSGVLPPPPATRLASGGSTEQRTSLASESQSDVAAVNVPPEVVTEELPPPAATISAGSTPPVAEPAEAAFHSEFTGDSATAFPPLFEPSIDRPSKMPSTPLRLGLLILGVLALVGFFLYLKNVTLRPPLLTTSDPVVFTEVENRTGESILDDSVGEGVQIALEQSPWLRLRDEASYDAARRAVDLKAPDAFQNRTLLLARQSAERLGAKVYFFGSLSRLDQQFVLRIDARDVATNDILTSAQARAGGLQQIPVAIDEAVADLRANLGEPRTSIDANSNPLEQEGSGSLEALHLLSRSNALVAEHEPLDAIAALHQAVALDPKFVQAQLSLANLYHEMKAETVASQFATLAMQDAAKSGSRLHALSQAAYEIDSTGDYVRAGALLRGVVTQYPHDAQARAELAETLREQGRTADALEEAQAAHAEDPWNTAAFREVERALLGLDRFGAAFQLDSEANHRELAERADSLTAAFLDGRQDIVNGIAAGIPLNPPEYRPDWTYGLYLDNDGRLEAGATLWRNRSEAAERTPGLHSAAALLLAQGALDRAILGECSSALALLHADGMSAPGALGHTALFNTGITDALCGDTARAGEIMEQLAQRYPQSFSVQAFQLADLRGAIALQNQDPETALAALEPARPYDLISLTALLRGRAHVQLRQYPIGIVDFQTVLAHRGMAFLTGSDIFPAAQLGVAHAFAQSGDGTNSADAYRRFLELWRNADPKNPLVTEAHAQTGAGTYGKS